MQEIRYCAERYAPRSWLIRDKKTGRIVAYPTSDYLAIARSWLRWEMGENGQQIGSLAEFGALVDSAVNRLAAAIEEGAINK